MTIANENAISENISFVPDSWKRSTDGITIVAGDRMVSEVGHSHTIAAMNDGETFMIVSNDGFGALTFTNLSVIDGTPPPAAREVLFVKNGISGLFDFYPLATGIQAVIDNLLSTSTLDALSAAQGKVLKDVQDTIKAITDFITVTGAINLDTLATDAAASKVITDFITLTQAVDLDAMETDTAASKVITDFLTVTQAVDLDAVETNSDASKIITDFITVTQAVNLDTIETDVAASKVKTDFITVTEAINLDEYQYANSGRVYLESYLTDAVTPTASDWTQALQAAIDALKLTGGMVMLPPREILINAPIIIDGMGVGLDGISAGFLGDFAAGDPEFNGPVIRAASGVTWGNDPDSGLAWGVINIRLDDTVFPANTDPSVRPRGFNRLKNFNMWCADSGNVSAIKCIGTMYFEPDHINIIDAYDGIETVSHPGWSPGSPNNMRGGNLVIQSSRNRPFSIVAVDGYLDNIQFGGNAQAGLFNTSGNFRASNLRGWNTISSEILRLSNCKRSTFGGHLYDGEKGGIVLTGDCDVHFDDMVVKGCNRGGNLASSPEDSSGVHAATTTERISGTLNIDGIDGYPPFTTELLEFGLHAEGTATDTQGLNVHAYNCISENVRILGADTLQGRQEVLINNSATNLFSASQENAIWRVQLNHKSTSGQVNTVVAKVIGDTTAPVIVDKVTSGAAVFDLQILGSTVQGISTSATLRTSDATWQKIN